jgi:hypothetical protein
MFQIDPMWAERQQLLLQWARFDNFCNELLYRIAQFEALKAKSKPKPVPSPSDARLQQILAADRKRVERARKRKRSH